MTANNQEDKINFFKNNILRSDLVSNAGGSLPFLGSQVGKIMIDDKNKTALIEIRQCAEPQTIAYYEGQLLCKDIEYETIDTEINGGVFLFNRISDNQNRYELQLNNNRRGIIIRCSQIKLVDFKKIDLPLSEYKDVYTGLLWGKYFSIIKNGQKV